ncbi:MAG: cyanophycinase [Bacteroidales bacterium]|nr:cyanophycinase [Bacteroidales bacterium]
MKNLNIIAAFSLLFTFLLSAAAQNPTAQSGFTTKHGPENGALVIIGGGKIGDDILDRFVALAGGASNAKIVVVSNASADDEKYIQQSIDDIAAKVGAKNVTRLHFSTIEEANDPKLIKPLTQATGIFFTGGRQWRISEVYLNTLAHKEMLKLLARGGAIAGTSAGASIQGSLLWRGDTEGYHIIIGDHTQGLGFLRNSAIDQHILVRNRQDDLEAFIRIAPRFIGIGIDESTAVVVQKDELEVIGKSYVAVHSADEKAKHTSGRYRFLKAGDKYDLAERRLVSRDGKELSQNKGL